MKDKNSKKRKVEAAMAAPETNAPASTTKTIPEIKRERIDVAINNLVASPWNPRGEISDASVADLVASIRTVGIIEPIVVMPATETGKAIIIAGHRRVAAAKIAGLATVPADQLIGIDVAAAKRMTFIENLQRKDADPLLESNLVAELVADGMTTDEIAAEIGRDRKWVLRRKNLSNLSPSWRKRVASGDTIAIDCLERIAAYPAKTQEKLKDAGKASYNRTEGVLRWNNIRWDFSNEELDLKEARFECAGCLTCADNTGCQPDLFDWTDDEPAALGKCLNAKCFDRKTTEHIEALALAAEQSGVKVIRQEPAWDAKTSDKQTRTCKVLYIHHDRNGHLISIWGAPPKVDKKSKLSAADKKQREKTRALNKALRALSAACTNTLADLLAARFADPDHPGEIQPLAPFAVMRAFISINSYHLHGCKSNIEDCAIRALDSSLQIPADIWTKTIAADIIFQLDPKRYGALHNAKLLLAMFGELRDLLGPEDLQLILEAADTAEAAKKFLRPAIAWKEARK